MLVLGALQFKGHTMSAPFKIFNIALASLMAVTAIASSIAAVRYIVVSSYCLKKRKEKLRLFSDHNGCLQRWQL